MMAITPNIANQINELKYEMPHKDIIHEISDDSEDLIEPEDSEIVLQLRQTILEKKDLIKKQFNQTIRKNGNICHSIPTKDHHQIANITKTLSKKEQQTPLALRRPDSKEHIADEVIDLESLSSCKILNEIENNILKTSSYSSSSNLIISSQSPSLQQQHKPSINQFNTNLLRPMLKNTIPSDNLQKYLACLDKKFTKLSSRDKVMSWKYSIDVSDVEDVVDFEEKRQLLKLRYRNNNICKNNDSSKLSDGPAKAISVNNKLKRKQPDKKEQKNPSIENPNNSNIFKNNLNKKTKNISNNLSDEKMLTLNNSPKNNSLSSTNSGWSADYCKEETNKNTNSIIICNNNNNLHEWKTNHNNIIQIRMDYSTKLNHDEIFKKPNVPRKYLPPQIPAITSNANMLNNKTCACDKKEEFCKYLGLETKSPENENLATTISKCADHVAELKRRSLRVRRLQIQQKMQNNEKVEEKETHSDVKIKNITRNGNVIKKANGCLGSNRSMFLTGNKRPLKNSRHEFEPKIKIICSINNNSTKSNENIHRTSLDNHNQITSKSITLSDKSKQMIAQKPEEIAKSKSMSNVCVPVKRKSTPTRDQPTKEITVQQNDHKENNPDSLIVIKRSYQHSPVPEEQLKSDISCKIMTLEKVINKPRNQLKPINNLQDENESKKIKIEFSTNYNSNEKSIDSQIIEKTSQTQTESLSSRKSNISVPNSPSFIPLNEQCKDLNEIDLKIEILNELDEILPQDTIELTLSKQDAKKQEKNQKLKKNMRIWTKEKEMKICRVNMAQSKINCNKKCLRILKKPVKYKKVDTDITNENNENLINDTDIKTILDNNVCSDDMKLPLIENHEDKNIIVQTDNTLTQKTEITTKCVNNIECNNQLTRVNHNYLELVHNSLPNPLKFEKGDVIHAYYECDSLIVIQEFTISFWKYSKVIQMLGETQEWELLGECKRKLIDEEIYSPYKNRMCINDSNPVYIELRARQLPNANRECNLASPYINVYYFDVWKDCVAQHSIQLDTIKCLSKLISYTTIVKSRYFVMCWKQDTILGTQRTGICKYSLTPDLDTLASIREFKNLRHVVYSLDCCDEDKLIGFGETQITIWDHRNGDVLTNFDLGISIGKNLGSLMSSIEFEKYLFLYQLSHNDDSDDLPELKIIAMTISLNTPSFRIIYSHELPLQFNVVKSSFNTEDYCIITALTGEEIWMLPHQPQRLLHMDKEIATSSKRFYSTNNSYFIEITGDYLNVKKVHENLLNMIAK